MSLSKIAGSVNFIGDIVDGFNENSRIKETGRTRRHLSDNEKETNITAINAQKEVMLASINEQLKIKQIKIDASLGVIDSALVNGNLKQLELGLGAMVSVSDSFSLPKLDDIQQAIEQGDIIDM